ncbi:hypothetical protein [Albidovulum sp.]|uniref:hypothetical protein n=1 Tax=Albidovulum sp. TaxID=1872424 RepID=UPI0039B838D9
MKMFLLTLPLFVGLAACQSTADQNVATGALTGAAVGAIASDDGDKLEGAVLGGAAGAAVGSLVGAANQPRQCTYRYPSGYSYVAPCQ